VDGQPYELVEMIRGDDVQPLDTLQLEEQHQSVRRAVSDLPQSLRSSSSRD
jgi:hypothetical protein